MTRFDRFTIGLTALLMCFTPLRAGAQPPTATLAPPAAPQPVLQQPAFAPAAPQTVPQQPAVQPGKDSGQPLPPPRTYPTGPGGAGSITQPAQLQIPCPQAGDVPLPINLAAALKLADARPLMIAAAQARAWVAEAQMQRAAVIWLPTVNMGFDYIRHDGYGPDFNRGINTPARPLNQNINFLYAGGGLTNAFFIADAVYQPLAARQTLNSRRWDIQTAKNDALMQTARAYFDVHRYRGMYAGALDVVERGRKLVATVELLSKELVPGAEVNRAKRVLADLQQQAASAREMWRVSSADLTQILRLDPRAVVVPVEHDHLQITLIDPARPLDDLIPIGLRNRPELASQQALVQAVLVAIRREKLRPLMPSILLNGFQTPQELIQFGAQGIGNGGKLNLWSFRDDFSPQVLWRAEGMGLGNLARIREQRGEQSRSIIELFKAQDRVAADVTRAQARLQSAAVRVGQAERSLREALVTFNKNLEGLAQTKRLGRILVQAYRPQEVVVALESLKIAYDEYFGTVADYNQAQFEMFHALGFPAQDIARLQPPGEPMPVDTTRPGYLPPVGTGPPPATR